MPAPERSRHAHLTLGMQARYASAEVGLNAAETALRIYLLKFYTDAQGLSPRLAGVAFALGLLWDAFVDPVMGVVSDRTAHRFGGRRVWILIGAALLAVGLIGVFTPPPLHSTWSKFTWLLIAGCLLNTGLTVVYVPYLATCNEMTDEPHQRSVLFAWRYGASNLGACVAVGLPLALALAFGGNTVHTMAGTSVGIAGIVLVGAWITWTVAKPWPGFVRTPPSSGAGAPSWVGELLQAATSRTFRPLLLAYVVASVGVGLNATTALYYYGDCLRLSDQQTQILLGVFLLSFTVGLPLWLRWSKRAGKLMPLVCGAVLVGSANAALYLSLPPGSFVAALLLGGVGVGLLVGCVALIDSLLTDVVDHDTIRHGKSRGGSFFGVWRFAQKVARAVAVGATGVALDVAGFVPNQPQTPTATWAITLLFGPGVGVMFLVASWILSRYRFDAKKQAQVQRILARRLERRTARCAPTATVP